MIPPPDPETAREAVSEVLSDDRFNWLGRGSKTPGWLRRVIEWIIEHLFSRGRRPPMVRPDGLGVVATVVIAVVLILAVALLWWAVLRWRKGRTKRKKRDRGADVEVGDVDELSEFTDRTEEEWAAEAMAAAAAGSDVNAIRAHYGRAVVAVISARWAGDNPGRTTGELAADVQRTSPDYAPTFSSLTRIFEDAWFGHQPVDRSTVEKMAGLVDTLIGFAGAGRTPAAVGATDGSGAADDSDAEVGR